MSISSKLQDLGFKLKSYSIGVYDCTCPFCSHKRKPENRNKKVCRVWIEDDMASYNCVHCGEKGYVLEEKAVNKKTKYTRPDVKVLNNLGEKAEQFFNNRGISIKTAKDMGVYISRKFPKPMIAFPYFKGGKIVNVKYRGVEEKTFTQEKDAEPVFYNYDNCFGQKEIIIVEGENDVLAFREVGINNVVSIPSGSINKEMPPDQQSSKFDFLKNSQPLLDSCEKIILALDNDEAGQCMTKALIDRLGMAKCYTVDWSVYNVQGKDANDFLKIDRNILQDAINNAKPVPIRGILRINDDIEGFEDYLIKGINNAISTGYDNLDRLIKFYYGNFITITGYPSSGKSNFALNLIFNLAQKSSIKTLLCSFENTPNQLKKRLAQIIIGKPTINASQEILEEIRPHYDWLNKYFYILQDYTTTLNVDNIMEITEQAILKYGIKCVILDPLNKIEYTKTNNQTEDIGSLLNKLINFAKRYNILMFLVAHPTKPSERKLGTQNIPSGFDIAGSANFLNMSDVILTVHRKQDEQGNKSKSTRILVSKVRDNDYGHEGSCYFKFEPYTGHYTAIRKIDFENEKLENNERDF